MASIFVAKLDFGVTEEELRNLFEQYGRVAKASIALDKETKKPRGFAFVEMNDAAEAAEAIKNLDGTTINGRQIAVKEADQRPDTRPNNGGGRPDFNRNNNRNDQRPGGFNRNQNIQSEYKKPIDDKPVSFTPPPSPDSIKPVVRKIDKDKDKKSKDWDSEGRSKKPKMNAYKKSGKNPKFFDDEDDEDWDLPLPKYDDEEDFDDDDYEDDED